jgi:hypothetical protein
LPELNKEELELQKSDVPSAAPVVDFLPIQQLKNNLLAKNHFIEQTANVFSYASVNAVYKEFMGEHAILSHHDVNAMTEYYGEGSELSEGPKMFNEEDPTKNSCYTVVQAIGTRANSSVAKLHILAEKLAELAPMWDEIKIRTQHSAR